MEVVGFGLLALVVIFIVMFFVALGQQSEISSKRADLERRLREKFQIDDELYISGLDFSFVGFSFDRGLLVLGSQTFTKEYMFSEVAAVDVVQNGTSVTSTNRGSQVLGAAVGGVAFGGVGLLVGALTGSKRTVERMVDLSLKVAVDDRARPVHYIQLFKWTDQGLEISNDLVKGVVEIADRLNAHVVNGMRKAAQDAPHALAPAIEALQAAIVRPAAAPALMAPSYAEKVKQLWDLHQAGALTVEEFQHQKSLLPAG